MRSCSSMSARPGPDHGWRRHSAEGRGKIKGTRAGHQESRPGPNGSRRVSSGISPSESEADLELPRSPTGGEGGEGQARPPGTTAGRRVARPGAATAHTGARARACRGGVRRRRGTSQPRSAQAWAVARGCPPTPSAGGADSRTAGSRCSRATDSICARVAGLDNRRSAGRSRPTQSLSIWSRRGAFPHGDRRSIYRIVPPLREIISVVQPRKWPLLVLNGRKFRINDGLH